MFLSFKVCSFKVQGETKKEAYLIGCKKAAKYVASKHYPNISEQIELVPNEENTLLFTLFTNIDLTPEKNEFCKVCREFHTTFYINQDFNCSSCKMKAFLGRAEEKARVSKNYYKKKIQDS